MSDREQGNVSQRANASAMVFEDPLGDESKELRLQRVQKAKGPNEVKMSWYYIQAVFHTTHTLTWNSVKYSLPQG